MRLPEGVSRRAAGITAALAIEALILLILLGLGIHTGPPPAGVENVTTFNAREQSEAAEEEAEPAPEEAAAPTEAVPQPQVAPAVIPPSALPRPSILPAPPPPEVIPPPAPEPVPSPSPSPRARAVIRPGANYGPADTGRRSGGEDSQIVGTAPDGSPLYAARWYTEPTDEQLRGYLSGARGPGWGLIACKTAPNWRVEDCVVLGESPAGSNIGNATNAAAWQFLVRPARVNGEYLVGSWVRIRLTYGSGRGPGR